ncbi:MAG: hypothetical protein H0U49_12490, partial [Parachlamydiaceae bacterium]|nr:hypothetical protein [Parachlamydiaceae bacterium]
MINSLYNTVFGSSNPTTPLTDTNSPTNTQKTTNAGQNALNGTPNSSTLPSTGSHKVSWIQGAWDAVKGGASLIYAFITHPLLKIALSVLLVAGCS